jgi:tetratricopeptide (TPR) repeat protein
MYRRALPIVALALAAGFLAAGCQKESPDAVKAMGDYFKAFQAGDYGRQYSMLAPELTAFEARKEFIAAQARAAFRRSLVKWEMIGKPPAQMPEAWRGSFRMTWKSATGKQETTWRGLSAVKRGKGWFIADTPSSRMDASDAYIGGDYLLATRLLARIIRMNPTDGEALDLMGYVLRDNASLKNGLDNAIEMHRQAVDLEPRNPDYHFSLGNDYRLVKWYTGAIKELNTAIEIEPRATYYVWLGVAQASMGRIDSARASWGRAIKIDPLSAQAQAALSRIK